MKGQALVTLLVFVVVSLIITSATVAVVAVNSFSASKMEQSLTAKTLAENGVENALLRLLRDPSYSGETLSFENGTVEITVTGSETKTIQSVGRTANFVRTVQAQTRYNDYVWNLLSWKEIF